MEKKLAENFNLGGSMVEVERKKLSWKKSLFFCLIILAALGIFLEFSLRLYDILSGQVLSAELISRLYMTEGEKHPFLEYTSRKNFHGYLPHLEPGKMFEVQTNSDGFRTREFYPKLPGVVRVVILGDSFVYGYNVNQKNTLGVVLEKNLRLEFKTNKIEVFALGVPSYSTIKYAELARIYFDYLKPDIVIVSVDQSDFNGDLETLGQYIFDKDGAPLMVKDDEETSGTIWKSPHFGWLMRLRFGSSLFNHLYNLGNFLTRKIAQFKIDIKFKKLKNNLEVIKYEDLVKKYGTDLSEVLSAGILGEIIPYDLKMAEEKYQTTFNALKYIKKECDKKGIICYLNSYPYPWMVSADESLPYQLLKYGAIYDMRNNRVHPQLLDIYATKLGMKHLNAYPVFEADQSKKYGDYDPHFNTTGYELWANFLQEAIKEDIKKKL